MEDVSASKKSKQKSKMSSMLTHSKAKLSLQSAAISIPLESLKSKTPQGSEKKILNQTKLSDRKSFIDSEDQYSQAGFNEVNLKEI